MVSNSTTASDNGSIENSAPRKVNSLFWWAALACTIGLIAFTWIGYVDDSFHVDDIHTIVENPAMNPAYPVSKIFGTTRAGSSLPEYAAYRPLTTLTYALDARFRGAPEHSIYQLDSFVWYLLLLISVYILVRMIPGMGPFGAMLATAMAAVHPLASQLLNYASQRHHLLRGLGLATSLMVFVVWPRRMPPELWLPMRRIPRNDWDILMRRARTIAIDAWSGLLKLNLPLYLIPLTLGLLSDPGTAVFPLLLLVWIRLFEPERGVRAVIPSAVLCSVWWVTHTAVTWSAGAPGRPALMDSLLTQPWVAARYVAAFFFPHNLPGDTYMQAFRGINSQALIGIGLLALVAAIAVMAQRMGQRTVAFGLWWFLIALIPEVLMPEHDVLVLARGYIPGLGFCLALTGIAGMLSTWIWRRESIAEVGVISMGVVCGVILLLLGMHTRYRNFIWVSHEFLWSDVLEQEPDNPRALLNYGRVKISDGYFQPGYDLIAKAKAKNPGDAETQLELALRADAANKPDAEALFRSAISLRPDSAHYYATFSNWLRLRQRLADAEQYAKKAVERDPLGVAARRSMIDVLTAELLWKDLEEFSTETIRLIPGSSDGNRGLTVAQAALNEITDAEKLARNNPDVENYLALASVYMKNGRFDDGIAACRSALKLDPNVAEAYANISVGYHMMGKTDDSIAALREGIRLRPDLPGLRENLEAELEQKALAEGKSPEKSR